MQIRDIDDEVYAGLVRRAAEDGITVPGLLRREATCLVVKTDPIGRPRDGYREFCIAGYFRTRGCVPPSKTRATHST